MQLSCRAGRTACGVHNRKPTICLRWYQFLL